MSTNTTLPPKENALFKRILKCYEQKQYKNGLKFAKQILSNPKFSEHGETLAMKGLTLSSLGKKDEAYDFVRKGLKNNLKSHVCWHAYGLLQRADRKYDEAIKCYRNALKWDKDNLQILRDLSLLQIQMRDLEGYRDTRHQLLVLRPSQKASWIGYAMAFHLLRDYDMTVKILEEFRKTQPVKPLDYEHSEMILYQNSVMVEAGMHQTALQHINQYASQIMDKLFVQETKGQLLVEVKSYNEAKNVYRDLLERNPENIQYYRGYESASQASNEKDRLEIYRWAVGRFPKALTPKKLILGTLSGELFRKEIDAYLLVAIRKGVPPLFKNLRSLYSDPLKVSIIGELVESYVLNLKAFDKFHPEDETELECPTSLLWSYFYLSQHYDHLQDYTKALQYIDLALGHTMTLIELYLFKAKILKHAGDTNLAVRCLDEAQSLDTADRYVNSKCTKYMLRAGMLAQAEEMAAKFTREGSTAMESLNEMQCMWFQIECANMFNVKGQFGEALKRCIQIDRHFTEIVEDQFDFHTYCMRKMTLRSYIGLLRLEDTLRKHKYYFKAASIAIQIYLNLYDHPLSQNDANQEVVQDELTPSEKKKLKSKQRKKAAAAALQQQDQATVIKKQQDNSNKTKQEEGGAAKQQATNNSGGTNQGGVTKAAKNTDPELDGPKEEELHPQKLEKPENALEEAMKFVKPLQMFCLNRIETHIYSFQIYHRKNKLLLMLQAIKRGWKLERNNAHIHQCFIHFLQQVQKEKAGLPSDAYKKVLEDEIKLMFGTETIDNINRQFVHRNIDSLPHLLAGATMSSLYGLEWNDKLFNLLINRSLTENPLCRREDCESVLKSLESGKLGTHDENLLESYRDRCKAAFPIATVFNPDANNSQEQNINPLNPSLLNDSQSLSVIPLNEDSPKAISGTPLTPLKTNPLTLLKTNPSHSCKIAISTDNASFINNNNNNRNIDSSLPSSENHTKNNYAANDASEILNDTLATIKLTDGNDTTGCDINQQGIVLSDIHSAINSIESINNNNYDDSNDILNNVRRGGDRAEAKISNYNVCEIVSEIVETAGIQSAKRNGGEDGKIFCAEGVDRVFSNYIYDKSGGDNDEEFDSNNRQRMNGSIGRKH